MKLRIWLENSLDACAFEEAGGRGGQGTDDRGIASQIYFNLFHLLAIFLFLVFYFFHLLNFYLNLSPAF